MSFNKLHLSIFLYKTKNVFKKLFEKIIFFDFKKLHIFLNIFLVIKI